MAGFDESFMSQLDNDERLTSSESQKQMITDSEMLKNAETNYYKNGTTSNIAFAEIPHSDNTCSEVLTVWRFMNYEFVLMEELDSEIEQLFESENSQTAFGALRDAYIEPIILGVRKDAMAKSNTIFLIETIQDVLLDNFNMIFDGISFYKEDRDVNTNDKFLNTTEKEFSTAFGSQIQSKLDQLNFTTNLTNSQIDNITNNIEQALKDTLNDEGVKKYIYNHITNQNMLAIINTVVETYMYPKYIQPYLDLAKFMKYSSKECKTLSCFIVNQSSNSHIENESGYQKDNYAFISYDTITEIYHQLNNIAVAKIPTSQNTLQNWIWKYIIHETGHFWGVNDSEDTNEKVRVINNSDFDKIVELTNMPFSMSEIKNLDVMTYETEDLIITLVRTPVSDASSQAMINAFLTDVLISHNKFNANHLEVIRSMEY